MDEVIISLQHPIHVAVDGAASVTSSRFLPLVYHYYWYRETRTSKWLADRRSTILCLIDFRFHGTSSSCIT